MATEVELGDLSRARDIQDPNFVVDISSSESSTEIIKAEQSRDSQNVAIEPTGTESSRRDHGLQPYRDSFSRYRMNND